VCAHAPTRVLQSSCCSQCNDAISSMVASHVRNRLTQGRQTRRGVAKFRIHVSQQADFVLERIPDVKYDWDMYSDALDHIRLSPMVERPTHQK
jgi:hypothetical protein